MRKWSVLVEARSETETIDSEDPRTDAFMDHLAKYGGVVSAGGHVWSARITVPGPTAGSALDTGADIVDDAAGRSEMPAWAYVRVELLRDDELERELARPTFPDVVGSGEVLELMGISKQRLWQLRQTDDFPQPMVTLSATPIWMRAAIESFMERWNRKVGRPSKVQELLGANEDLEREIAGEQMAGGRP